MTEWNSRYYSIDSLRSDWEKHGPLIAHVDATIDHTLARAGHSESSYYSVPGGYALVTRLEQINVDGTPKETPARWTPEVQRFEDFTLSAYIKALFRAKTGYYRVIVFIISIQPFAQTDKVVSREESLAWLRRGFNVLPEEYGRRRYTEQYECTALVYEFEKKDTEKRAIMKIPSRLPAWVHLRTSGIEEGFK